MRFFTVLALSAALVGTAAQAATTLEHAAANFTNPVGDNSFITYTNSDGLAGNERINWGQGGTPTSKSGLGFVSATPQAITQGAQFTLGTLTFFNVPITSGTGVTSVDLGISPLLTVNATPLSAGPFTFAIGVEDTPNESNVALCPYFSTVPCSDKISIATGAASQTFELGGQTLTLFVDGFLDAGLNPQSSFLAQEGGSTTATLVGHFDVASIVPEPASWAMFICGFGFLGTTLRRDRRLMAPRVA